ncbi:hypothetical protein EVAR_24672_1 [Eumeta japonica]|uniref:Uncharacterized protein n=1 Tax=Eumeta variegata TaxID=151549 RepID=A0A4C1WGV9_EUMVA|nr:hypothetical protein EVAR_24672_1 [Eumeta japonica]
MRSLRSICGVSQKDRCRNNDIRERCALKEDVVTRVAKEQDTIMEFGINIAYSDVDTDIKGENETRNEIETQNWERIEPGDSYCSVRDRSPLVTIYIQMTIFKLTSCCGCVSLRAGALLVGYLQLGVNLKAFVLTHCELETTATFVTDELSQLYLATWIVWEQWNSIDNSARVYRFGVPVAFYLKASVVITFTLFTISLLFGIHRRIKGPIKSYLIYMALMFLILFTTADEERSFVYIFIKKSSLMTLMFFWLVIASYYYQMDDLEAASAKISNV